MPRVDAPVTLTRIITEMTGIVLTTMTLET